METQIEQVMRDTGMDRVQAYYHVRARQWLNRNYREPATRWR